MKEQFVTYEIALILKELGFDEPCIGVWRLIDSESVFNITSDARYSVSQAKTSYIHGESAILAPLWQQAIDWIFKKLEINYPYLRIEMYSDGSGEWYHLADERVESLTIMFDTKEEAVLKVIELIKNGSTQKTKTD